MKKCRTLSIKNTSEHPHLEPPCCLIYSFMTEEEIKLDDVRRELHMREHLNKIFKTVKDI